MRSITLEFISDIPGKGEHDLYHMGQNCVYRREKTLPISFTGMEGKMSGSSRIRTDLALEATESFAQSNTELRGVEVKEQYDEERDIRTTVVKITTENGAKAMGKPVGTYLTIETPNLAMPDEKSQTVIAEKVCSFIKELIRKFEVKDKDLSILVVGLGNREVTPDSLGPCVADHLSVTRHIVKEYGKYAIGVDDAPMISAFVAGMMGQT